ncbi:uncharacterized protein LOC141620317 [Silene latifolia]|uniref:uncharacterized protein LOC141620317 n=1 Tax=Silene latifolia TaxID=37657 RepID=UPI003D78A957
MHGVVCSEVATIEQAFIEYYQDLLGSSTQVVKVCPAVVKRGRVVTYDQANIMLQQVTETEIKEALCSIPVEKAPGPDGYSAGFFRDAYDIIGGDVVKAVKEFFSNGRMLQQINATVITLIPKVDCPSSVQDFRPIACCSVIYKCISKIICRKLSGVLVDHISMNQSAFVKDREIVDNILIFMIWADVDSITILLRAFLTFSEASGLCMNKAKSDVYLNGVYANLASRIVRLAGFKLGQIPFRIFLLPKGVIHKVASICRNYLWAGHAEFKHAPPVAWETCCLPKEHGGLGIINCHLWNVALLGKYAWWIHKKKDSLWVQWVHHIYIKQRDWWMYEPSQNSSWTWRQIFKVKDTLKPGFLNGTWNGKYSIQVAYQWLLGYHPKKDWVSMVWNRVCVPKHNFSTWIYVQQRFLTRDRLQKFGVIIDGVCYLCGMYQETHSHLFFYCPFSMNCLVHLQTWLQIQWQGSLMDWLLRWRCRSLLKKQVVMAAISGLIYSIWDCRNRYRLEHYILQPARVVKGVHQLISLRLNKVDFDRERVKCKAWLRQINVIY